MEKFKEGVFDDLNRFSNQKFEKLKQKTDDTFDNAFPQPNALGQNIEVSN